MLAETYSDYNLNDIYFLYPLHFHPESSTSILAGNYLDEYDVIKTVAYNLPEGVMLYVKDHKSAWGYPSLSFYRKLARLPNVKVLHPCEPTKVLIKNSKAVITLTSTVGYEALLLGKRVLLFGRVFYEFHKDVEKIKSKDDIFAVLSKVLNSENSFDSLYNEHFVQAYWISTYPGKLNLLNKVGLDDEASEYFMNLLMSDYNIGSNNSNRIDY